MCVDGNYHVSTGRRGTHNNGIIDAEMKLKHSEIWIRSKRRRPDHIIASPWVLLGD